MRLSTKVAHNTVVQFAGKIIATLLGIIALAMMARYLGAVGFGQYTTVITFLSFFSIAADFGLTLTTSQMISRPGADQEKILSNLFGLRLVSAAVFLSLCAGAVFFFPYDQTVKFGVVIAALAFFFTAMNQVFIGLFQKNLNMDKAAIAELAGRIILVIGLWAVIASNLGLLGILAVSVISSAINFLINYFYSKKIVLIKFAYDKNIWREIVEKSWPLAVTIIFNLIYLKTDTLILSLIKSDADVGLYGAAYRVIDVIITIPFMFAGVVLPIIAASWAENNIDRFKKIFQRSFDFLVIVALPLAIGTQFAAKPVMILIGGEEFGESAAALKILILAAAIIFLNSMFAHGIIAINKQKKIISSYVFTSIAAVSGYLIFIPTYSYLGAAWVTVGSETVITLASAYIFWKNTKIIPNFKIFFKSLMAGAIMAAIVFIILKLNVTANLFLLLILATTIYFAILYFLKGISRQDLAILLNK